MQQEANVLDLIATTQKNLGKAKFTVAASDLQDHVAFNQIMRQKRTTFGSGTHMQWNVMVTHAGAAHVTGLFAVETPNYVSVMKTASVPFRHITSNHPIDERVLSMNRSPARIVNMEKVGRVQVMIGIAELVEELFWEDTAAANTDNPLGIPYYIVRNASTGFNGGNPTYDSTNGAGSLDSGTYTRWSNHTYRYTNISKTDLIRGMRRSAVMTKFRNPVAAPEYGKAIRRGIYSNYDVVSEMEERLEDQNDNLGNDLAPKDGQTVFRGVPIVHVPYLDSSAGQASQDPVYGIDWGTVSLAFLRGEFLKKIGPLRMESQPRVVVTHYFCSYNLIAHDRRKLWICDKA